MIKKFYVIPQVSWADLMVETNFVATAEGKTIDEWEMDDTPINL